MDSYHPVGTVLHGGYRVIDVLQGGMGIVYICYQPATDQYYALKTIRFDGPPREIDERVRRFSGEVNNWIQISLKRRCENVVSALAFNADERILILEFIDGLPLDRVSWEGRPVHPKHALDWARDIARGLRVLHSDFQLVHRDLKPQNVLIERSTLKAKVTDLGIGKVLHEKMATGTLVGTPAFMAPECFKGRVDFRSDIFSFGATLFWMLTGENAQPISGALDRDLGSGATRIIERCLQDEPDRRYLDFSEVCEDLSKIDVADLPTCDESLYSYCEIHRFHSPRSDLAIEKDATCLFCHQQQELHQRLKLSETSPAAKAPAKAGTKFVNASDIDLDARPTAESSEAPGPAPAPEAATPAKKVAPPRWIKHVVPAAIALALVAVVGFAIHMATGGPGSGDSPATSVCAVDGCSRAAADSSDFEAYRTTHENVQSWEPDLCRVHGPWMCAQCTRRFAEDPRPGHCPSCGGLAFEEKRDMLED